VKCCAEAALTNRAAATPIALIDAMVDRWKLSGWEDYGELATRPKVWELAYTAFISCPGPLDLHESSSMGCARSA